MRAAEAAPAEQFTSFDPNSAQFDIAPPTFLDRARNIGGFVATGLATVAVFAPNTLAAEPIAPEVGATVASTKHHFKCNQHYYDRRGPFHALEGQHFTRYRELEVRFDGVPSYDRVRYNVCLPAHRYKVSPPEMAGKPRILSNPTVGDCRRGVTSFPSHWILTCGKHVTLTPTQQHRSAEA